MSTFTMQDIGTHAPRSAARPAGFAMMVVVTLLGIVISVCVVLLDLTLSTRRAEKTVRSEGAALRLAHAGVSKAIFCLNASGAQNCGGVIGPTYPGESNVGMDEGTFTTVVTTSGATTRNITSTGTASLDGRVETVLVSATTDPPTDAGIAFSNATVAGAGGTYLYGTGASVTGDMQSVSDIHCYDTSNHVYGVPYVSKDGGVIDYCTLHSDAHADKIQLSTALRDAYYRGWFGDLYGTSVTGVKYSGSTRPSAFALPAVDTWFWHDQALAGGLISGNYAPADGASLGPVKINGDLTLNAGVHVTVTGTIWVTGNIVMNDSSSLTLASNMGEFGTVILADSEASPTTKGKIDIRHNSTIAGSGQATSFVLLVSTNTSVDYDNPAIKVDTSSTKAAYLAPNGVVRLTSGDTAAALAGWRVYVNSGAAVNFTGTSLNVARFGSYPPGTWRTLGGSYRER